MGLAVQRAETAWVGQSEDVTVEFVLPVPLLNQAVDRWRVDAESPLAMPLCVDYPVVPTQS